MNSRLVEIYSGNTWEVEIVKGLLENEGIKVVENQIIDFENHFWQPEICK